MIIKPMTNHSEHEPATQNSAESQHTPPSGTAGRPRTGIETDTFTADPTSIDLPGYELLEEIGRGGMGVVYRAIDTGLNRDVAVKLLQERYSTRLSRCPKVHGRGPDYRPTAASRNTPGA